MSFLKRNLAQNLPYILIVCGLVILIASFFLSFDEYKLLLNHSYRPSCNFNPVVSCGDTIKSKQGQTFGFPNPYIGLFGAGIVLTSGMVMLAVAKLKRWYWVGMQIGTTLGIVFLAWLLYESLYNLHALCPFCLAIDAATITTFWYVTLYNVDQKNLKLAKKLTRPYAWIRKHHLDLLILIFIVITAFILKHFWYYYGKHL